MSIRDINSTSLLRFLYLRESQIWLVLGCLFLCTWQIKGQSLTPPRTIKPLGVNFTDVAQWAGLNATTIYGDEHKNRYLLETTGSGAASSIMTMMDGWTFFS